MSKTRILFIEDDAVDRMAFKRFAEREGFPYEYVMAGSVAEAEGQLKAGAFDLVIADYMLGDGTALDILALNMDIPVIIATGAGSEQIAVEAMKAGAYDYLIKDPGHNYLKVLQLTIERALKQKRTEELVHIQSRRESAKTVIIGDSEGMTEVHRLVELAASSNSPVLITGETGTGKNLVARAIHYGSAARAEPFICVNCLSLADNLIEAELFGCERGAFTGATSARKGLFEMADRGAILLDEIGDMPVHLQGKLLGVIEDGKVRRLGGEVERHVNVRIMASTNVDIEKALGSSFRSDLYYRLSIIRIHVPPLRERPRDIPALCGHLLKGMTGRTDVRLADSEMKKLIDYDWPGNVRELKNVLERALILRKGDELRPSGFLKRTDERPATAQNSMLFHQDTDYSLVTLEELEKRQIKLALHQFPRNRMKAAEALGISLATLKRRIRDMAQNEPHGSF
ncbi:MAG: sigma-54-dependent Fis family transcriptional regulator [Nitrospirae bacterium]|nr:sigma-54-dependent Fis family transcriptional regulator [Nitrospirota bacterium]